MTPDEIKQLCVSDVARLVDFAERPRVDDWTLRSALVRYAQRLPVAASAVLELIRRTDGALAKDRRRLETVPLADNQADDPTDPALADLLVVASILDRLGDILTTWAADTGSRPVPSVVVDELAGEAFAALGALGVERENRPPRRAG